MGRRAGCAGSEYKGGRIRDPCELVSERIHKRSWFHVHVVGGSRFQLGYSKTGKPQLGVWLEVHRPEVHRRRVRG